MLRYFVGQWFQNGMGWKKSQNTSINLKSSNLIQNTVYLVLILHLQHLWSLVILDAVPIQKEAKRRNLHSLSLSISLKDFSHFGGLLDLEERLLSSLSVEAYQQVSECYEK